MRPSRFGSFLLFAAMAVMVPGTRCSAAILVDFNESSRTEAETNEPGWVPWPVADGASASKTISGISFKVSKSGSAGSNLTTDWYKVGVQNPYYARLVCDGLTVKDGNSGGAIKLEISGLPAGTHSLLAYHNGVDGNQWAEVNVDVDGTRSVSGVKPTNRILSTDSAAFSYVSFDATAGKTVTLLYSPNPSSSSSYKNVILNAIALDVPNPKAQASSPSPDDRDLHVDADGGTLSLSWASASGAVSHNVYLGTDSAKVASATATSSIFQGAKAATTFKVDKPSNLKVYWWRIDEVDASGKVTTGNLWRFSPRHLAFPGAEGYGRYARGGRGGKVVHVTKLDDDGSTGTFRWAITDSTLGPRTIVFDVGGTITLKGRLTLSDPFVTVAGQTAPGLGVQLRSAPFGLSGAVDDIVRFMKVRIGYGITYDGMGGQGSNHTIFDHNTINWSIDEGFSSREGKNLTLQRTMIAECLNHADHLNEAGEINQAHGYAATIGGRTGSYHHNLLAFNEGRNWSIGAAIDGSGTYVAQQDIFNNVVYGFGGRATDGETHYVNFVGNYYKRTAASSVKTLLSLNIGYYGTGTQQSYYHNNVDQKADGSFACDGTNDACGREYVLASGYTLDYGVWLSKAPFASFATVQSAKDAYKDVLSDVGVTQPATDTHDLRVVRETIEGKVWGNGSITGKAGLPDRETDVGGFMPFPTTNRASNFDSDGDGLPDWYEAWIGTNAKSAPNDFADANGDVVGDGYTNLERYLEFMATPHAETAPKVGATFDLAALFRGYQKTSPTYKVGSNTCLDASMSGSSLTVTPKTACGVAYLPITATDKDGSTMTRAIAIRVTGSVSGAGDLPKARQAQVWIQTADRLMVHSDGEGTLVVRDLQGKVLCSARGIGVIAVALPKIHGAMEAEFVGDGFVERRMLVVAR